MSDVPRNLTESLELFRSVLDGYSGKQMLTDGGVLELVDLICDLELTQHCLTSKDLNEALMLLTRNCMFTNRQLMIVHSLVEIVYARREELDAKAITEFVAVGNSVGRNLLSDIGEEKWLYFSTLQSRYSVKKRKGQSPRTDSTDTALAFPKFSTLPDARESKYWMDKVRMEMRADKYDLDDPATAYDVDNEMPPEETLTSEVRARLDAFAKSLDFLVANEEDEPIDPAGLYERLIKDQAKPANVAVATSALVRFVYTPNSISDPGSGTAKRMMAAIAALVVGCVIGAASAKPPRSMSDEPLAKVVERAEPTQKAPPRVEESAKKAKKRSTRR